MVYKITCTFTVKGLRSKDEALETGMSLAEHVLGTFNDDNSIDEQVSFTVEKEGRK